MFDKEEIVITATLKRAKLITRKTGKTTIHYRKGFVKVVIPLIEPSLMWELLKAYDFQKNVKIYWHTKKRKGDKIEGLLVASILTSKQSKRLWHYIFGNDRSFKLTFDDRNFNVRGIRKWRQMLRGIDAGLPFDVRTGL